MTLTEKIISAALVAGAGSAALAEIARGKKIKDDFDRKLDVNKSGNTIVVPILKSRFMSDVMTPEEQKSLVESKKSDANKALLTYGADNQGDIESLKKNILRSNSVSFDPFRKRAEDSKSDAEKNKSDEIAEDSKEVNVEDVDGAKSDGGEGEPSNNTTLPPRDSSGRFVSETDPNAVRKEAQWYEPFVRYAKKPAAYIGGGLLSIGIAAMITNAINKRREEKSKRDLDEARDEYIKLLESSDDRNPVKTASDDGFIDTTGTLAAGAFLVPFALTALVTNRILENRRREKRLQSAKSNSIPDEKYILWRTVSGEEKEISPETALAAIMQKKAMIEASMRIENALEKDAAGGPIDSFTEWIAGEHTPATTFDDDSGSRAAADAIIPILGQEENAGQLYSFMKKLEDTKGLNAQSAIGMMDSFKKMLPDEVRQKFSAQLNDPRFFTRLAGYAPFQDMIISQYDNPNNADTFGADRQRRVDDALTFKDGNGVPRFAKGGFIHQILSFLMNVLGLGNGVFNSRLKGKMNAASRKYTGMLDKDNRYKIHKNLPVPVKDALSGFVGGSGAEALGNAAKVLDPRNALNPKNILIPFPFNIPAVRRNAMSAVVNKPVTRTDVKNAPSQPQFSQFLRRFVMAPFKREAN